jgi:hypothetical protein
VVVVALPRLQLQIVMIQDLNESETDPLHEL